MQRSWQAALIHVGGAGTHYARRDPFGNLQPKSKSQDLGKIGPHKLALLENSTRDSFSSEVTVEVTGYEGEWFDPYDVQGYLEEKGIFVNPSASFAEAEIIEWSEALSSASDGSDQGPQTPEDDFVSRPKSTEFGTAQLDHLSDVEADVIQWDDFADMGLGSVGFSDAQMDFMKFLYPGEGTKEVSPQVQLGEPLNWKDFSIDASQTRRENSSLPISHQQPSQLQPRKKAVVIDVAKFIDGKRCLALCFWLLRLTTCSLD